MADYNLQYQDAYIDALLATANELKTAGYIYKGVATPSTNPGTPTERVAYLASEPGTYTSFGGLAVTGLSVLTFNGSTWSATLLDIALDVEQTKGTSTTAVMSQKAVTDELNTIDSKIYADKVVDLSQLSLVLGYINNSGGWTTGTSSSKTRSIFVPVMPGKTYIMTQGSGSGTQYYTVIDTMFTTTSTQSQSAIDYATGYSGRVELSAGNSVTLTMPNDGHYLIVRSDLSGGSCFAPTITEQIAVKDMIEVKDSVDLSSLTALANWVGSNGSPVANDGSKHLVVDIAGYEAVEITAGLQATYYTWASGVSGASWTPLLASRYTIDAGLTSRTYIPQGAYYLIIGVMSSSSSGIDYTPSAVSLVTNIGNIFLRDEAIISDLQNIHYNPLTGAYYAQGGVASADGSDTSSRYRVRSEYMPTKKGDVINIAFHSQQVRIVEYDDTKTLVADTAWYTQESYAVSGDGYVRIVLANADSSTNLTPDGVLAVITMPVRCNISDLNADMKNRMPTLKRPPRVDSTTKGSVLTLLHFSDLHIDRRFEIARIIEFYNLYTPLIDDILNTGDTQDRGFESGIANYTEVSGTEKILQTIGNHDCYKSPATSWSYESKTNVYNRFIKPFVSNWGVTQPANAETNGYNYWYKDYADYGIRLIGIDVIYWDSTEQTWLQGVLSDALTNEYAVICAAHYKPAITNILCNMDDLTLQESTPSASFILNTQATDAVQTFISNGGEFICWLSGHEHKDYVGYATSYTDQLVIGVALAQCGPRANYGVMDRVEGMKSQDLFNVVGFDTYNKQVRIMRVGADFDCFMRSKKTLCINYSTKAIVAQT